MAGQSSILANRLSKNLRRLKSYIKNNQLEAYRIYDHDIPDYPYYIERFAETAVVWCRTDERIDSPDKTARQLEEISKALKDIGIESIFIKSRKVHSRETQYKKKHHSRKQIVKEGPLKFELELTKYLDVGLFLDHRPLRQLLLKSQFKSVLNLFCYTGSLSLAAVRDTTRTTNVDLSKTYLDWSKRNFTLNGMSGKQHRFVKDAVQSFLAKTQETYDCILLDPPTHSKSKTRGADFDVQKDHVALISQCVTRLSPGGILYFSTNKKKFRFEYESPEVKVRDLSKKSIPPDFHRENVHRLWQLTNAD